MKNNAFLAYQGRYMNVNIILDTFEQYLKSNGQKKKAMAFEYDDIILIAESFQFQRNDIIDTDDYKSICDCTDLTVLKKFQEELRQSGSAVFFNMRDVPLSAAYIDIGQNALYAGVTKSEGDITLYLGFTSSNEVMLSNDLTILESFCETVMQVPNGTFYVEGYLYNYAASKSMSIKNLLESSQKIIFLKNNQPQEKLPPITEVYEEMKKRIVGQDEAIKNVLLSVYNNLEWASQINDNITRSEKITLKENNLLIGPSGCGKTEIVRQLGEILEIPVIEEDIQKFSPTGYKGIDISEVLEDLYSQSHGNLKIAERSILFLDEIDKKIINDAEAKTFGVSTLNHFLKIMEGGKYTLSNGIIFDTTNVTVICAGAFMDLFRASKKKYPLGFEKTPQVETTASIQESLIKYGIPAEFLGRIKRISRLKALSSEDKIHYLLNSKLSILNLKLRLLEQKGITVCFREGKENFAKMVIDQYQEAFTKELGLRGLNAFASLLFDDLEWQIYSGQSTDTITLDEKCIRKVLERKRKENLLE